VGIGGDPGRFVEDERPCPPGWHDRIAMAVTKARKDLGRLLPLSRRALARERLSKARFELTLGPSDETLVLLEQDA
jgi:hypothetical protein